MNAPARIKSATFIRGCTSTDHLPTDGRPLIGLCGRSNCGKSTLLNLLTSQKRLAKVSRTPGRTLEANLFLCNDRFYLVDLPGFGFAKVSKARREDLGALITEFIIEAPNLAGMIFLLDVRHEPSYFDTIMEELLQEEEIPTLHVATKADKVGTTVLQRHLKALRDGLGLPADTDITPLSSTKGFGVKDLQRRIAEDLLDPWEREA